jgi:quercetin dioxygenase-like cupin family protein
MIIKKLTEYFRGWVIGDFEPSILRTKEFEIGILTHKKDEHWPKHYHKIATEYNILVSGKMILSDSCLNSGDIFIINPNEVSEPIFVEDCTIVCIKIPSVPGDKYLV